MPPGESYVWASIEPPDLERNERVVEVVIEHIETVLVTTHEQILRSFKKGVVAHKVTQTQALEAWNR